MKIRFSEILELDLLPVFNIWFARLLESKNCSDTLPWIFRKPRRHRWIDGKQYGFLQYRISANFQNREGNSILGSEAIRHKVCFGKNLCRV